MATQFYTYEDSKKFSHHARMKRVEHLARWLDTRWKLPGTEFKFGLDGAVGLIPGIGDTITTVMAAYIIYEAHQMGAPMHVKARMGWNLLTDWLLGLVPLVGDILDMGNKANMRNVQILRRHFNIYPRH